MEMRLISYHSGSGSLLNLLIMPSSLTVVGQWDDLLVSLGILGIYSLLMFGLNLTAIGVRDRNMSVTLFGLEEKIKYPQIKWRIQI